MDLVEMAMQNEDDELVMILDSATHREQTYDPNAPKLN